MTLNDVSINDIVKHLEIIEKEADQIGNYSGEYNHKFNILKSVTELKKILEIKEEPALDNIRAELIQSIQNGTLKIESGNEELFRIIDKYKAESDE